MDRKIVIPGEMIIEGEDYLPGDLTQKIDGKIYSTRYGLAEEQNNLIKIIPLSGIYNPRRGNTIIGKVTNMTQNGWIINIGSADNAFLSVSEVPRYVNKDALDEVLDIGEMVIAKIWSISKRGIDVTTKSRGLGLIQEGIIFQVNPNKVPRIIGKEGSMINLIKDNTNCNITVAQNGFVLIKGPTIDEELFAKKAILHVVEKSFVSGLTDEVTKWFEENVLKEVPQKTKLEDKK
ncbi:MAG: exosome complex RNA-binding protein Rrp4 [Nanoarchaeota archaeon]|nr:exosome complex RNA-binding protein Rrp4 [Nanoarchaeota archaeon]